MRDQISVNSIKANVSEGIWPGIAVIAVSSVVALAGVFLLETTKQNTGAFLILSFLLAAAISPQIWVSVRKLPVVLTVFFFGLYWLQKNVVFLPVSIGLDDVLMIALGSGLIQRVAQRTSVNSNGHASEASDHTFQSLIHPASGFERALQLELLRSRRHEHPFCLVILKFDTALSGLSSQDASKLNQLLGKSIRWIDHLYMSPDPCEMLLICPETQDEGTGVLAKRLRSRFENTLKGTLTMGWAEFPTNCLTGRDLISAARKNLGQSMEQTAFRSTDVAQVVNVHNQTESVNDQ